MLNYAISNHFQPKDFIMKKKNIIFITIILIIYFFLSFVNLDKEEYGNIYYSACVKSMSQNFNNFFYASLDPASFLSIDKPPLGMWIQTLFVLIFGYNTYSLMLPQIICGILSILILFLIVNRYFGAFAALVSGFSLAVTPIFVAVGRNNTPDMILVFFILLATYFLLKSIELNKFRYFIISIIFVGIGFNIKMLQAFMVLPAFYLTYYFCVNHSTLKKIINTFITIFILIVISFSWILIVDMVPQEKRPYVGSSLDNSMKSLVFGYNGILRLIPIKLPTTNSQNNKYIVNIHSSENPILKENGKISIFRLFNKEMGLQTGIILIIAIIFSYFFIIYIFKEKNNINNKKINFNLDNIEKKVIFFWFWYFLPMFFYFSFSGGIFHTYYLVMIVPSIAFFAGIGINFFYNTYIEKNYGLILKSLLILTVFLQGLILFITSNDNLTYIYIAFILVIITGFLAIFVDIFNLKNKIFAKKIVFILFFISIFTIPFIWSLNPSIYGINNKMLPRSEKKSKEVVFISKYINLQKLMNFLENNRNDEKFIVATPNALFIGCDLIINSGKPVLILEGFNGMDNIFTIDKLKDFVDRKLVRFFLIVETDKMYNFGVINENKDLYNWIKQNGIEVPKDNWFQTNKLETDLNPVIKLYDLNHSNN